MKTKLNNINENKTGSYASLTTKTTKYDIIKNDIILIIDDYKRKLKNISDMIDNNKNNGSENDIKRTERFTTKQSEYRTFISELERIILK